MKNHIGVEIIKMRRRLGWSQHKLAAESLLSLGTIKSIELGRAKPSIESLFYLCEAMGTTPSMILMSSWESFVCREVEEKE